MINPNIVKWKQQDSKKGKNQMTHTELLNHIRHELKNQNVTWKKEQELFELLLPDENWKKFRSTWYSWKPNKEGVYTIFNLTKSSHILSKISKRLFLDISIWRAGDIEQLRAVKQGVSAYVQAQEQLDLSAIIPQFSLNETQEKLLEKFQKLPLFNIHQISDNHPQFFTRTFPNQAFLLALLNLLYAKGAYEFLIEKVFPNLMAHQRSNIQVKILEAHLLGSLKEPRFMEAVKLLDSIESQDTDEIIDLKTSTISNLRRFHLANSNFSNQQLKEGLVSMVKSYHQIFAYKKNHHYYPAINLMYALVLANALRLESIEIDPQKLYTQAKPSIKRGKNLNKTEEQYYASMSELEFELLLGKHNIRTKIGGILERLNPSLSLVNRTKRQMVEFLAMAERLGAILGSRKQEFEKVIKLLNDYEKVKQGQ